MLNLMCPKCNGYLTTIPDKSTITSNNTNMFTHQCTKCYEYFIIGSINENNKIEHEYKNTILQG